MVNKTEIVSCVERKSEYSWEIHYQGATCKFESDSPESAVIYDLEVPKHIRGRGIGTTLLEVAEQVIKENTEVEVIYAQVGAEKGATEHVLSEKRGFNVVDVREQKSLGRIVDAEKNI